MHAQGEIFANAERFMRDYDLLICPAAAREPYPVGERFPGYADGLDYADYYRWLKLVYAITATTLPVITIPCGLSTRGLPVGLQLIGKPHGETALFAYARHLESLFGWDPLQLIRA
jgi:amidase